jgi:hypothetical protein
VKESDVEHLPDLLHERRSDAQEMGGMARQVWEQYFAPEVSLQRLIEAAGVLMAQPYGFEQRVLESRNMLFQPFLNMFLARLRRRLLRSVAGRFQGDAH